MDRSPEVQHIPFERTIRPEALEDVLAEMDRERSLGGGGLAVYRARATTLPAMATQLREQAQMPKHLLHAHLMAQECEVHLGARSAFRPRRTLDRPRRGPYRGGGRCDHFFRGEVPLVAHGVVVGSGCGCGGGGSRR